MARKKNHLYLLMKELSISGNVLADYLRVDSSLISKWRSGSRKINTDYLDKIVDLMLSIDSITNYQRICRVSGFSMCVGCDAKQVREYLRVWLPAAEDDRYSDLDRLVSPYGKPISGYIFIGETAKREAVKIFLDFSAQGSGQDIWLYSDQGTDWLFKDTDYRFEWQNKNFAMLENNKIHILHPIFKDYQHVAEYMIRWLPLHMYGETQASYIPQLQISENDFTICLTAGAVALVSLTTKDKTQQTTSYLLSDPGSLRCIQNVLASLFNRAKPLFQRYSYRENTNYCDMYQDFSSEKTRGLYFGGGPPQCLIPSVLLQSFFNESDYSYKDHQRYQHILQTICYENTAQNGLAPITVIIHLDQLCNLLQFKRTTMRTLSYCMGRPIFIHQAQFRQCLMAVLDIAEKNSSVHLFLSDHSVFHPHADIDMFIRERKIANFTSSFYCEGNQERNLAITEDVVVSALFHNMSYYAQVHPNCGMSIQDVRLRIQELFQKYKIENCIDVPPPLWS